MSSLRFTQSEIAEFLIKAGIDPSITGDFGWTAEAVAKKMADTNRPGRDEVLGLIQSAVKNYKNKK